MSKIDTYTNSTTFLLLLVLSNFPHPRSLKSQIRRNHTPRTLIPTIPPPRIRPLLRVRSIIQHHNIRRSGVDSKPVQTLCPIHNPRLIRYATHAADSSGTTIARTNLSVKESPKSCTVEEEVGATVNIQRESHLACLATTTGAPGEIRVAEDAIWCPRGRSILLRAYPLPVCRFGLLHARVYVLRVMQVVIVEGVVFESGAGEPCAVCGFDEQAAARGDVLMTAAFE